MSLKEKFSFLKWLDPFTFVEIVLRKFHPKKKKPSIVDEGIDWIVYLVSALVFAFLIYSFFGLLLQTSSPMVIVVSGSMEPVFFRGDVVVLHGKTASEIFAQEVFLDSDLSGKHLEDFAIPVRNVFDNFTETVALEFENEERIDLNEDGDIIVYFSSERNEPIIHRIVAKIVASDGIFFLTKGDSVNNPFIDQEVCGIFPNGEKHYCVTPFPINASEVEGVSLFKVPFVGYVKLFFFDDLPRFFLGN